MNLNQLFPRLSIRAKLAIAFAGLAILPALAVAVVGVGYAVRQTRRVALTTLEHDVAEARDKTQHVLGEVEADLSYLAGQVVGPRLRAGPGADWTYAARATRLLLQLKPVMYQVKAVSARGELLFASRATGSLDVEGHLDEGAYYATVGQTLSPGAHAVLPVELRGTAPQAATVPAMAIIEAVHAESGEFLGAAVVEARAAGLFEELESGSPHLTGVTGLLGPDGLILYHSERKASWAQLLATRSQLDLEREVSADVAVEVARAVEPHSVEIPGRRIVSYAPMHLVEANASPLVVYRIVPSAVLESEIRSFLGLTALSALGAAAAVLVLAVLAAHQFTQPLYRLRAAARRLAGGGTLEGPLSIQTRDELQDLAEDFSTMAVSLARRRKELEDLVADRTQALGETVAELEDILQHSADAIVGLDADRRVRVWNDGATALFEYTREEAIGRDVDELLLPEGERWRREAEFVWRELEEMGVLSNFQTERAAKGGGHFPVSLTQTAIRDDRGQKFGYSLIIRDTTLQTRLEEQMRSSERLASLSVMAGGLAHEIGNPLAVIENRIECMQREIRGAKGAEPLEADLEVLSQHAERIHGLVGDFLGFARDEESEDGSIDLNDLVRRVSGLLDRTSRSRRVALSLELDEAIPEVPGNAKAIETVCMNLLLNALDATPPGGCVTVRTRQAADLDRVRVEVSDTGPGIPPEIQNRVFEPFFTTKEAGKGTGLGLAVCRAVMARHGGSIRAHNEARGATLKLDFPTTRFEATWLRAEYS